MAMQDFIEKKLYPINYIAQVCNISRATIMRFEEEGLLIPEYKDPESGYRYYSRDNVAQVISILRFQKLGFTKKEIKELKSNSISMEEGLQKLKINYQYLLREIEDLTSKIDQKETIQVRALKTLGGYFFKRSREMLYTPQNLRILVQDTLEEFIYTKHKIVIGQTMKAYLEDADLKTSIGQFDGKKHICSCIVPINEGIKGNDIVHFQPSDALTLVCQCDFNKSEELFWKIWNEAKKRGLHINKCVGSICIAGFPDILFTVDPITNQRTLRLILLTK